MKLLDCVLENSGLYTFKEASLYAHIPVSTLKYWFVGAKGRPPVRHAVVDESGTKYITFQDFIEAVAIRYVRTTFKLPLPRIREAVLEAMEAYKILYPFSDKRHRIATDRRDLHIYIEGLRNPVQLSGKNKRQASIEDVSAKFMEHLRFDASGKVQEFVAAKYENLAITLNPGIMFGSPRVNEIPYSAITLWRAKNAEKDIEEVARMYEVDSAAVLASCRYCEEELRLAA